MLDLHVQKKLAAPRPIVHLQLDSCQVCMWIDLPGEFSHLYSSFGVPGEAELIGQHCCSDSGAVVASPTHQHHPQPWHTPLGTKRHLIGAGRNLCPVRDS